MSVSDDNGSVFWDFEDAGDFRWCGGAADVRRDIWSHAGINNIGIEPALVAAFQSIARDACDVRFRFDSESHAALNTEQTLSHKDVESPSCCGLINVPARGEFAGGGNWIIGVELFCLDLFSDVVRYLYICRFFAVSIDSHFRNPLTA